ncbi:MAG: sterol desaturase family protein [Deltaproteobacteria bacterium]|nr:sterol desaturase family protein [Deltaproteobacteria bacterium]
MSEIEFQIIKSIGFVIALAAAIGLQRFLPHAGLRGSWRVNGRLWALNAVILGIVCAGCACTVSRWAEAEGLGLLNRMEMNVWMAIPIAVLGLDGVSYVWHRANHRIPLLWRFHQVHHSDPNFTTTTAVRFHFGELLLALPLRLLAIIILGVSIPGVIVFELIFAFANFFEHGDIDLPLDLEKRLAFLFITPALHRRHHSREARLLNSNYGTIFSFWDRAFRSFGSSRSDVQVQIGLPGVSEMLGPKEALMMPARGIYRGQ